VEAGAFTRDARDALSLSALHYAAMLPAAHGSDVVRLLVRPMPRGPEASPSPPAASRAGPAAAPPAARRPPPAA
jgi:hypothetical protein